MRFKQWLEVHQRYADRYNDFTRNHKVFENIFKGQERIVLPFYTKIQSEMIEKLKNKYIIDHFGMARYHGSKNMVKVGKVIKQELGDEAMANWAKEGGVLAIVLSRKPIDVLRASDFKHIQNCMTPGSDRWLEIEMEAKEGGAVAYLVSAHDLRDVDLNKSEIFADPSRNLDGIMPIADLFIKRYVYRDKEIGIPERRSWGAPIPGFREFLLDYFKKNQDLSDIGRYHSYDVKGAVTDSDPESLFSDLLR